MAFGCMLVTGACHHQHMAPSAPPCRLGRALPVPAHLSNTGPISTDQDSSMLAGSEQHQGGTLRGMHPGRPGMLSWPPGGLCRCCHASPEEPGLGRQQQGKSARRPGWRPALRTTALRRSVRAGQPAPGTWQNVACPEVSTAEPHWADGCLHLPSQCRAPQWRWCGVASRDNVWCASWMTCCMGS